MEAVSKQYQDELQEIKKNVKNSYEAFKPNYDRFNEFRRFIFETSLTSDDISLLNQLGKPNIEFNITETYISRLMGEFSKLEPATMVSAEDEDKADPLTIHVVEQHLRHALCDSKNNHVRWEIMKDIYSGGFSVGKITTPYAHAMSFDHVIDIDRAYDPTLCGFDQLARRSHKGDGRFCFELFPQEINDFKREYPDIKLDKVSFARSFAGYNWAYMNGKEKILIICDYYKKKKKRVKIVQLSDGKVMQWKQYKERKMEWDMSDNIIPFPAIKGTPRMTEIETICRYRCIESEVIEYVETDFEMFPLIFFDGHSIMLRNPKTSGSVYQMTRPYVYHAKGAQKLKNFAGITLANEMENMIQHKFLIAKEALPKEMDFLMPYKDMQKPSNLVYNAFYENDPSVSVPAPIPIQRPETPPEVVQTFASTDSLIQNILGSYDAALGINDNQLSGTAIIEAATQSNAAAMPYVVGFLQGLQRVAEVFVNLIPKYYKTPKSIPVMGIDGKCDYVKINQDQGVDMFYDSNVLNVKVEAGVSFQIQKSRALQQIIALMNASPMFGQFMNEKGLPVLLDNIEIRGIDQLKLEVESWQQEMQQQKQMMQQQQQQEMQNNPAVMKNQLEMQKLGMQKQKDDKDFAIDMQKLAFEEKKLNADIQMTHAEQMVDMAKVHAERYGKQVDLDIKSKDMHHKHLKESIELHHNIHSSNRDHEVSLKNNRE